jgi:AcrR family transcriptional regulator
MRPTRGQRERLREALTALVAEFGYPELKIGQVVTHADVSRQAFYRLFADKDHCFRVVFLATAPFAGTTDAAKLGQHGTPTKSTEYTQ